MIDTKLAIKILESIESNAKDGRSRCSRRWIAEATGCDKGSVDKYVNRLHSVGLLKRLSSNLYEVKQ